MTTKNQSRLALAAYKAGLVQSPDSKLNDVKPVNMTSVDIDWHEPQIKSETQESILCCQQLMPSCQHLLNSVDNPPSVHSTYKRIITAQIHLYPLIIGD
ncbi:hypothetical protein G6F68_016599 [Rhizopus microsporus]|nr:hypothetical protein G6F68_016599 [Rhizopus microsporus]